MIKGFLLGLQFLTRLPVGKPIAFSTENLRMAISFFPIIGLVIGGIVAIPVVIIPFTEYRISGLLCLLLYIWVTGGMHLDGVADVADGFYANRDRERTLEIMKDSHIGAFGVIAIALVLLSKYILYAQLSLHPASIIVSMVIARWMAVAAINWKKTAATGSGEMLRKARIGSRAVVLLVVLSFTLAVYNVYYLIAVAVSFFVMQWICRASERAIRGITGDVLGTIVELCEIAALLSFWGVHLWT